MCVADCKHGCMYQVEVLVREVSGFQVQYIGSSSLECERLTRTCIIDCEMWCQACDVAHFFLSQWAS